MTIDHVHDGNGVCARCGGPAGGPDRDIRFVLPDPVLVLPERENTPGVLMNGQTAGDSVMMLVPAVGAFIRCLLPVRLSDGGSVTYGVWISVQPDELRHANQVWWEPEYASLHLTGSLANEVPPGGALDAPVVAVVRDEQQTPWIAESEHPVVARLLTEQWPASAHPDPSD